MSHHDIFGDTSQGVPNPYVPFVHGYPTRFHGAVFNQPGQNPMTYVPRPFEVPQNLIPLSSLGASCGCGTAGLGADTTVAGEMFKPLTGSPLTDGILGVAAGFFLAPKPADRPMYVIVGGAAGMLAGMAGLIGATILAVVSRSKKD